MSRSRCHKLKMDFTSKVVSICLFLVNAYIVDIISLRENSVIDALLSSPTAANSEVENEIAFLIKGPGINASAFVLEREIFFAIDEKVEKSVELFRQCDSRVEEQGY